MKTLAFKIWTFEVDDSATRAAYAIAKRELPGGCDCCGCRNLALQREAIYPAEVLSLFRELGVDYRKEAEVCWPFAGKDGRWQYGWWLHFVGRILSTDQPVTEDRLAGMPLTVHNQPEQETPLVVNTVVVGENFSIGFWAANHLALESLAGKQLVQVECFASLPWVLEEPEPKE